MLLGNNNVDLEPELDIPQIIPIGSAFGHISY